MTKNINAQKAMDWSEEVMLANYRNPGSIKHEELEIAAGIESINLISVSYDIRDTKSIERVSQFIDEKSEYLKDQVGKADLMDQKSADYYKKLNQIVNMFIQ